MLRDMHFAHVIDAGEATYFLNQVRDFIIAQEKELKKKFPKIDPGDMKHILSQSFKDGLW